MASDSLLRVVAVCVLILLCCRPAWADDLHCGIARGFPPYQFQNNGQPDGFDADVARLVFEKIGRKCVLIQKDWDTVFNSLRYGDIDVIVGMEVNDIRKTIFDFTTAYYQRQDVVFIRADDNGTVVLEDLYDQVITGDRHSFVENHWQEKGIKGNFRILQTETKQEALELLKTGKTKAAIMPKKVGFYLADQLGLRMTILEAPDPGSPVAIAVLKRNRQLLETLEKALTELIAEGETVKLHKKWFSQ